MEVTMIKCAKCRSPADTVCMRDYCPQGIAIMRKGFSEIMPELERTCHTPEDWRAAAEAMLRTLRES